MSLLTNNTLPQSSYGNNLKVTIVGIGDYACTDKSGEALKTIALGSCVALVLIDKIRSMIGMIHIALPESSIDQPKAKVLPGYFADTGIPLLLQAMHKKSDINAKNLTAKLIGGANKLDPKELFNIGKRNILAVKKILWQYGIGVTAEDVGGVISRNVTVYVDTKEIRIEVPGGEAYKL